MAKVFLSYSRKDIEFAKQLTVELQKSDLDFWIDWEGIPPTVDWWKEIEKGIEEADMFLFLLSPDSVNSKICGHEIDAAVKNGKRIIPVVVREIKWEETPSTLSKLNYIFFTRGDAFDTAVNKLMTAIHTDYEWVATHRRLQVKALEWERKNKENSLLLRGKDLQEAKLLLEANAFKEPHLTELQNEYVSVSRKFEEKLLRSARLRRNVISVASIVSVIIIFLALTGKLNRFIYRPESVMSEDDWVTIPAGKFLMGSSDKDIDYAKLTCSICDSSDFSSEEPQHWVDLSEYQIEKYEVTNRQYSQCVKARVCAGNSYDDSKASYPVTNVNWYDAVTYCKWIGGRLPTEAEWEKAASWDSKTQTKFLYPWGNDVATWELSNFNDNAGLMPVGTYRAGENGLFNMAGNVMEWTSSFYYPYPYNAYDGREDMNLDGYLRILRGGSWLTDGSYIRSASRYGLHSTTHNEQVGFRCAH